MNVLFLSIIFTYLLERRVGTAKKKKKMDSTSRNMVTEESCLIQNLIRTSTEDINAKSLIH